MTVCYYPFLKDYNLKVLKMNIHSNMPARASIWDSIDLMFGQSEREPEREPMEVTGFSDRPEEEPQFSDEEMITGIIRALSNDSYVDSATQCLEEYIPEKLRRTVPLKLFAHVFGEHIIKKSGFEGFSFVNSIEYFI